jgi:hypothetical protein
VVFFSHSHWCSKGRATTLRSSVFTRVVVDQKKISKREQHEEDTQRVSFLCRDDDLFCRRLQKKKFCGTLLSVESIRIEAHTKREREREREKKPHKKRNKIVSKKRDFFTRSVDLGFRVLLIP